MRHNILRISVLILFLAGVNAHALFGPKTMSVQVRKSELRSSPSFLGKVVTTVNYGDRFTVVEEKNGWTKVSNTEKNISGWIHSSALTKKKVELAAGSKDAQVAASSGELALAGKGFSSDVEAKFKANNSEVDFTWIDKMEKIKVSTPTIQTFLKNGKVTPAEGGAK